VENRPKILCVDDERLNRVVVRDILSPNKYQFFEADNGLDALEILEGQTIDIVLLDINMPGLDGFEVCRRIKSNDKLRQIPVIMITALSQLDDRIRGIEAGSDDYINKPFNEAEVLARIRMLLKVRELNEKLSDAYSTIKELTVFGESIIKTFEPSEFDLLVSMDSIVGQLIRRSNGPASRPSDIILGIEKSDGQCHFYRYLYENGQINRTYLDLPERSCSPFSIKTTVPVVNFYNQGEIPNSPFENLVAHLGAEGIPVQNMVTYASSSLSMYALNYESNVSSYEATVIENLVMQALFLKSLSGQIAETEEAFNYTVYSLARAAEIQDLDTADHIKRVGEYCSTMASKLGLPDRFTRDIRVQATLHDIGKLNTSKTILQKPGKLDTDEWAEMKKHTLYGAQIIGMHQRFELGRSIALSHHEKWDGTGYPAGLEGAWIPIEGRIMALADTYDALRSTRVYKSAYDHEKACRIILEGDDRTTPEHFDPEILSIFKTNSGILEEIFEKTREN